MQIIAVPAATDEGLTGACSGHFGQAPFFALVTTNNGTPNTCTVVKNCKHEAGGCGRPVAMLAEHGVTEVIVSGMGRGPYQKMQEYGITVFYTDRESCPDVATVVQDHLAGKLNRLVMDQLCTNNGSCHHH